MSDQARIETEIRKHVLDGRLPCIHAHAIARDLGLRPLDVGQAADQLDVRVSHCQLGLFGYNEFGTKQALADVEILPERVTSALHAAVQCEDLPCVAAWSVAAQEGLPRPVIGALADKLELRVAPCQLGCF